MADLRQASVLILLLICGCARLSDLTPDALRAAQTQWEKSGPASYHMVVETSGDHMDTSKYEVTVRAKAVVKLERNGSPLQPEAGGNSYTVEGLFHTLDQEIDLKGKPQLLGAPPGYASYPDGKFRWRNWPAAFGFNGRSEEPGTASKSSFVSLKSWSSNAYCRPYRFSLFSRP